MLTDPRGSSTWRQSLGQMFNVFEGEAKDVTARPAIENMVKIVVAIYSDAKEKLGAGTMDGGAGEWLNAAVETDEEVVVFR